MTKKKKKNSASNGKNNNLLLYDVKVFHQNKLQSN